MATEVKLPRLGQGMESGTIVRWLKTEGDAVSKGEPLYELDTDKVTQEVEAESDGVLLKIVIPDGEVDVGTTVGIIGAQDEDVAALGTAAPLRRRPPRRPHRRPPRWHRPRTRRRPQKLRLPKLPPSRARKANGSRRARSPGGSPASVGSSWPRSPAPGQRGA